MQRILVIQTAFIGDVVLATGLVEKLSRYYPEAKIDFLLRKGNETLLANNPHISEVLVWNKKEQKFVNLFRMIALVRKNKYDRVINLQRFFSTGLITAFSKGKETTGFSDNPLSFLFSRRIPHIIGDKDNPRHEVERNNDLVRAFTDDHPGMPRLYPSPDDEASVQKFRQEPYITITPGSVWFTKKFPAEKWIELIKRSPTGLVTYLLGGRENREECMDIRNALPGHRIEVLAGELSFLRSAALMKGAGMNYVNDSAPLHFASAVNAPVTAVFCSTVTWFGFTPLSDRSFIVENQEQLPCRPCGLHGRNACPKGHFRCAMGIDIDSLMSTLPQ